MNLKKSLFTLNDSFPWLIGIAFTTLVTILALRYQIINSFDSTGSIIVGSAVTAIYLLTGFRYAIRAKYTDEWNEAYQCDAGCAVINRGGFKDVDYDGINNTVSDAAQYWVDWGRTRTDVPAWVEADGAVLRLENTMEYKTIFLVVGPIEVYNPYFFGKAAGLVDLLGNPVVAGNALGGMINVTRHEVSHCYLTALGIPLEKHEEIFRETRYC
jgi:hypothetical protein